MNENEILGFDPRMINFNNEEEYLLYKKLNDKKIISFIKEGLDKIGLEYYDYLLNWEDTEYSIIHFIKTSKDMELHKLGWHIWVIEEPDEDMFCDENECEFIQTATGEWGTDTHILTCQEKLGLISFFLKGVIIELR